MKSSKIIYAIIVTYNGKQWIEKCLGSLESSSVGVSIVVVDNDSNDGTPEYIQRYYPHVTLLYSESNLGFAKANNIGIRYALDQGATRFFLLNQDAWVESDTIEQLCLAIEKDNNIGIVSPMHMSGDGENLDWGFAEYLPGAFASDAFLNKIQDEYSCRFINAAAWMISKQCIKKVGGFDTSLFCHYGEDDNYCQRVRFHGFQIKVITNCRIFHDRYNRKLTEIEYQGRFFNQSDTARKIEMGNILVEKNIQKQIDQNRRAIIMSLVKLRFRSINQIKTEIAFLEKVKFSRVANMNGGEVWL